MNTASHLPTVPNKLIPKKQIYIPKIKLNEKLFRIDNILKTRFLIYQYFYKTISLL